MIGTGSLLPPHLRRPIEAPEGVILQLREVDARAELVNISDDIWWLGVVAPNEARRARSARALARMLGTENAPPGRILRAMLGEAGFTFIAEFRIKGHEFGVIVTDFRERDFNFRHRPDETFEERANEHEAEKVVAKKDRLDEIRGHGRDTFEFALKNPHSVSTPARPLIIPSSTD